MQRLPPRQLAEPRAIEGRVPPHDLDAEAAVLSAILLSGDALDRVLDVLKPEHFYSDANGRIFEAAAALSTAGTPVDLISVASWLRDRERLAQIGGAAYLAQIADATPAVANVAAHAQVVAAKSRVRKAIATMQIATAELYGDVGDPDAYLEVVEQQLHEAAHPDRTADLEPLSTVLKVAFEQITAAADRGDRITGASTGYEKLDAKTAGLHDGDLMIVAGRPGMGKTAFVLNMAVNVVSPTDDPRRPRYAAVVCSLEMPREQLATRMVCSEARVDLGRLRSGFLQPNDWRRLTEASSYLSSLPIWIDDSTRLSLVKLRSKLRRASAQWVLPATDAGPERRIGLVVVDYLQLMKGREDAASREQEISEISRGLKEIAKEFKVPVVALSQLNRAVETRSTKDKRPQLSDLRESGAIEQDADTIIFIYRDEYYNPETTKMKGIAELIVAKQRNGPTGKVFARFAASCTRFDNLAPGDYPAEED